MDFSSADFAEYSILIEMLRVQFGYFMQYDIRFGGKKSFLLLLDTKSKSDKRIIEESLVSRKNSVCRFSLSLLKNNVSMHVRMIFAQH